MAVHGTQVQHWIAQDRLRMAVQPIVQLRGVVREFAREGLLRIHHPSRPTPRRALWEAERAGLLHELAEAVWAQAAHWLHTHPEARLFLNVHPDQLRDVDRLLHAARRLRPYLGRVTLEITEQRSLLAQAGWREAIRTLRREGFELALDDLGAGDSTFRVLAQLEPDFVKLDMSLVRDLDLDPTRQRRLTAIARFAAASGIQVIAEGVERACERDALVDCGVDLMQGYFFGTPQWW